MTYPQGNVRLRCGQCGWHGRKGDLPTGGHGEGYRLGPLCPQCKRARLKPVIPYGGGKG